MQSPAPAITLIEHVADQALIKSQGFSFSPQLVTTTTTGCQRKFGSICIDGSHISRGGIIAGETAEICLMLEVVSVTCLVCMIKGGQLLRPL